MPEGSTLRATVQALIREEIKNMATVENKSFNEQGVIVKVNTDGTVDVQTRSGTFQRCGTPRQRTKGENVILVTADGQKVAL